MVMYLSMDIGVSGAEGVPGNILDPATAPDTIESIFDYVRVYQDSSGVLQV